MLQITVVVVSILLFFIAVLLYQRRQLTLENIELREALDKVLYHVLDVDGESVDILSHDGGLTWWVNVTTNGRTLILSDADEQYPEAMVKFRASHISPAIVDSVNEIIARKR